MAIGAQLPQTLHKAVDAGDKNESGDTLKEFAKCAVALREVLYQDRPLNEAEFLFMDNHFQVLQMAYLRWKRRHPGAH